MVQDLRVGGTKILKNNIMSNIKEDNKLAMIVIVLVWFIFIGIVAYVITI
jgi:hypothetical protein